MKDRAIELQQTSGSAQAIENTTIYRRISPRLEFAAGGQDMQRLLFNLSEGQLEDTLPSSENSVASGWIALEAGAHLPAGDTRSEQVEVASQRFSWLARNALSGVFVPQSAPYAAKLGLAATYAYQAEPAAALEDGPGYYAAILEDVLNDKTLKTFNAQEYRGLVSELTCATLASHLGYLTLPASTRHDKPLKQQYPSFAHDLQIWLTSPTSLPSNPDRKIQVKTSFHSDSLRYAPQITMVSINDDFRQRYRDQLAISLVKLYRGDNVDAHDQTCIGQNGERLEEILQEPVSQIATPTCRVRQLLARRGRLFSLPGQRDSKVEGRSYAGL